MRKRTLIFWFNWLVINKIRESGISQSGLRVKLGRCCVELHCKTDLGKLMLLITYYYKAVR